QVVANFAFCGRPAGLVGAYADDAAGNFRRILFDTRGAMKRRGHRADLDTDGAFDTLGSWRREKRHAGQEIGYRGEVAERGKNPVRRVRDLKMLFEMVAGREVRDQQLCSLSRDLHRLRAAAPRDGRSLAASRTRRPQRLSSAVVLRRYASPTPLVDDRRDGAHDADIAGTPAQIAAQPDADQLLVGMRKAQHQVAGRDEHSRRAVATLQRVLPREGRTQFGSDFVLVEAFDGGHLSSVAAYGIGDARPRRDAIEQHRAGAAHPVFAAEMGAGQIEFVTNKIGKTGPRLCRSLDRPLVYRECNIDHAAAPRI